MEWLYYVLGAVGFVYGFAVFAVGPGWWLTGPLVDLPDAMENAEGAAQRLRLATVFAGYLVAIVACGAALSGLGIGIGWLAAYGIDSLVSAL